MGSSLPASSILFFNIRPFASAFDTCESFFIIGCVQLRTSWIAIMIIIMITATVIVHAPLLAIALLSHCQSRAVTVYAIPDMNRFFKLMNAPVIDTIVVMTRAAIGCNVITSRTLFFRYGVIFRTSRIMMKNITKTMKKTIVSRTLISVDSL